ncbi:LOW QUALITY PROTEIN: WD40 repeat-containing protein HOS15-like isoform X4 [Populus alba x Populus x berolinensis]|uniref:WD40 repeat-containing protein HOS15-like isoform X4 n=1 Tax=Populus alba x Populus x berolinensis TaxID=444605 RepID=A0AAD6W360_9ROSI|nr:LOW QUALITY PROTEIN: WD40 repeat-containing protein HOS15-like isoform X4 [Populus alba x Populus x berolinensis]
MKELGSGLSVCETKTEKDLKVEYICPFCGEDFDVVGLFCHINEKHPAEAKNGVSYSYQVLLMDLYPVCAKRVGMDIAHEKLSTSKRCLGISYLVSYRLTVSELLHKRRARKGGANSAFSILRKELQEGSLQSLLGGSSCFVLSSNTKLDPLLSPFIFLFCRIGKLKTKVQLPAICIQWMDISIQKLIYQSSSVSFRLQFTYIGAAPQPLVALARFTHSAFALGYEGGINKCTIDGNMIPPGALITFVQKGLQYLEMEANLSNSDADVDEDFSFLQPLDLITKDVNELQQIIKEKKKNLHKDREKEKEKEKDKDRDKDKEFEREHERECARVREKERHEREKEKEKDRERLESEKERDKQLEDNSDRRMVTDAEDKHEENEFFEGPEPMDISITSTSQTCEIPSSDVMILEGHTSEVCACAWSPIGPLLASGAREHYLLQALMMGRQEFGAQMTTLSKHKGPIFTLKWNKKGDYLLTGSCDKTAIVWDVRAEEWKQQFEFHSGPTLDVDWRNNVSFATSSTDNMIYVCKVGETRPIKSFAGHQGEVNCVKWDPTGSLLASCSDDISAKIWSMKQDKYAHDLREHSKEIYTIRWSPTGPGTNNPNQQLVLASASFDSTVKLWDVEFGKLLSSLNGHREPVYSVAFSPNGEYLASGSLDRCINIWSLKEGKIVKTYTGNGGIFEVCWNKEGDKIAACFANNTVCVLDFRM